MMWYPHLVCSTVEVATLTAAYDHSHGLRTGAWRRRYAVPIHPNATAAVLSNSSVLRTGRSLPVLAHPVLPLAILGYGRQKDAHSTNDDAV